MVRRRTSGCSCTWDSCSLALSAFAGMAVVSVLQLTFGGSAVSEVPDLLAAAKKSWAISGSSGGPPAIKPINWEKVQQTAQSSYCAYWSKRKPHVGYWDEPAGYSMIWHYMLPHIVKALKTGLPAGHEALQNIKSGEMYLFGVAQGESMHLMNHFFPGRRSFGFDSFKGLPKEDHEQSKIEAWREASFPGIATEQSLVASAGGDQLARVIPGFFRESLHPELVRQHNMTSAFYVDIDCDLHSSTMAALDFVFQQGLARVGTIIAYDDWWTIPCRKFHHKVNGVEPHYVSPLSVGEGLAHVTIASKYKVSFRCVAGSCKPVSSFKPCHLNNNWAPVFIVETIGSGLPASQVYNHGFEFTAAEEEFWMANMAICPTVG
ncbi:unnamed protein product [Polarella glacialis]|uniref:Methyltransferase n=1 Tax=Polarella glacialis TaxID=89957 RepID=A0A813K208_POLGL|nr:unnamed protein product [Polarella glacialis]